MLPTLIRDDQLVRANALISALGTIGTIISAVVGGYLVVAAGPEWNFHINAATFVLSALFLSGIRMSQTRAVPHPPLTGVWRPVADGFRYVRQHRRVFQLILLGTVFWAAAGMVISMIPAIVKAFFAEDYSAAGNFRGIIGIGLATGATFMTIVGPSLPPQLAVLVALPAASVWILLLAAAYTFQLGIVLTGLSLFGIGGAGAALLVTIMATIQRFVPDSRRGRVFGVADMATMGAMVLATGALGLPNIPNLDSFIPLLLVVTGVGFAVVCVLAWREYRRGDRHLAVVTLLLWMVRCYARFWCRMKRVGVCTIPTQGPVIVAANHTAGVDPLLMQATSPFRVLAFLVAEEYYHRRIAGWFMKKAECIPIDRKYPGKSFLTGCLRTLKHGGCLGIFPQGTWAEPGQEEPGAKSGVGLLALRTGATVIPCHISGTRYFDSPFAALFVRHNVRIRYGKAVDLSAFAGREEGPPARGGERADHGADSGARAGAELSWSGCIRAAVSGGSGVRMAVRGPGPTPTIRGASIAVIVAGFLPVIALLALRALGVPLGQPGKFTYLYSELAAVRMRSLAPALSLAWTAAAGVWLLASGGRRRAFAGGMLASISVAGFALWACSRAGAHFAACFQFPIAVAGWGVCQ